jgi:hypothetical protein
MRLKHMTEDKWNARGAGRREQRTHQPTGGRGNEGGLRIGEMERDAITGHGMAHFTRESYMTRGDGTQFIVCNGCGTIPIYNEKENFYVCPLCDGPVKYTGDSASNLELLPPNKRSLATFSKVEFPYVVKLLEQELATYMNIGLRFLTNKNLQKLPQPPITDIDDAALLEYINMPMPEVIVPDTRVVEYIQPTEEIKARPEDLAALGAPIPMSEPPLAVSEDELIDAESLEADGLPLPQTQTQAQTQQETQTQQQTQTQQPMTLVAQNVIPSMMMPMQQMQPQYFTQQQQPMQQMQQMQPMMAMQPMMSMQPVQMLNAPIPGAPPTFVVDTSPQAMMANGFQPPTQSRNMQPQQSENNGRPRTRRSNNRHGYSQGQSGGYQPQQHQEPQQQSQSGANVRVTIQKLGA